MRITAAKMVRFINLGRFISRSTTVINNKVECTAVRHVSRWRKFDSCAACYRCRSSQNTEKGAIGYHRNATRAMTTSARHCKSSSGTTVIKKLHDQYIFVRTSTNRWEETPNGLVFDVGYLDSHPNVEFDRNLPTVMAFHDIGGNHGDIHDLVLPFAKMGCRVICPSFPGGGKTKGQDVFADKVFFHSIEEKAELIGDFCLNLGVTRIDMLIAAGGNAHPAVRLCAVRPDMFRSLALIDPWGSRINKAMQPYRYHEWLCYCMEGVRYLNFLGRMNVLGRAVIGRGSWSMADCLALARSITSIDFTDVDTNCLALAKLDHPRSVIYSDESPDVEREITEETLQLLKIPESAVTVYDSSASPVHQGEPHGKGRAIRFQGNGNFDTSTRRGLIVKECLDLLQTVKQVYFS